MDKFLIHQEDGSSMPISTENLTGISRLKFTAEDQKLIVSK